MKNWTEKTPDYDLLRAYSGSGDEDAFAELVRRRSVAWEVKCPFLVFWTLCWTFVDLWPW
jgi:hypothetical protein